MPSPKTPAYKASLTPSLHRRFTKAALILLAVCYVESVIIGHKQSWLWSWFPIGMAGIRTLLLFISAFSIFILRVAQLHVSTYNARSPANTFLRVIFSSQIPYSLAVYTFSAWFWGEIYFWSAPPSSDLGWTAVTKAYGVPRLNERPIFLRLCFVTLAVLQTYSHIASDASIIPLPKTNILRPNMEQEEIKPPTSDPATSRILSQLPKTVSVSLSKALLAPLYTFLVYYLFFRRTAWQSHMWIAKTFVSSDLRPTPTPHDWAPPAFLSVVLRCISASFLLMMQWKLANSVFTAYVGLEPLKNGQPLTNDSKDPNGSLILGLKSKKEIPQSFAMWELLFISLSFPARRRTIFSEIERLGGPSWKSILDALTPYVTGVFAAPVPVVPSKPLVVESLPRLTPPMNDSPVLAPSPRSISLSSSFSSLARTAGSSDNPSQPLAGPALHTLSEQTSSITQKLKADLLTHPFVRALFTTLPLGEFTKATPRRDAAAALLESSALAPRLYAIQALAALAVHSLEEDEFGNVQKDIANLIKIYTDALTRVVRLVKDTDDALPKPPPPPSQSRSANGRPTLQAKSQSGGGKPEMRQVGSGRNAARTSANGSTTKSSSGSGSVLLSKQNPPVPSKQTPPLPPLEQRSVEGLWVACALSRGLREMLDAFDPYFADLGVGLALQREAGEVAREGTELAKGLEVETGW